MANLTKKSGERAGARRGERRLPMALAVIVTAVIYLGLPADFRIVTVAVYAYPALLLVFLLVMVVGDPGRIDRDNRWLRIATGVMITVMTVGAVVSAMRLVSFILRGDDFGSAQELLKVGAIIWASTVIAFSLWYWHLDCGGPTRRAKQSYAMLPAFHFPEQDLDSPAFAGWYPQFVDYLSLSFNTATAFGPADVSAVRHWSKLWLMSEAAISFAIVGLVIASAVNQLQ